MWYFGELTKLYAYRFMCYVFQVVPRIATRHRHDCTHWREIVFMILGFVFYLLTFETYVLLRIMKRVLLCLKMKILFENLCRYKLVSEPWFEGFGCTLGCVWTQTEDLRKIFKKRKKFLK